MPADKCPAYNTNTNRAIWPGARMEKEEGYDGWYKLTCTFDDPSQGAVMLFNNMVADTTADTASGGDEITSSFQLQVLYRILMLSSRHLTSLSRRQISQVQSTGVILMVIHQVLHH